MGVPIGTRIDPTGLFHKHPQLRWGDLTSGDVPQCPRPFADRLVIDTVIRRATNDGAKRICILVDSEIGKFERMSHKPAGSSPYFVMVDQSSASYERALAIKSRTYDNCKHGF
jgi:hypothetical protein